MKRICLFAIRTSALLLLTFGLVFLVSLLFRANIYNTMFLFGILLIGMVGFSFLDETMLISSSSCGKRMSMSVDIYNKSKSHGTDNERRKTRFAKMRLYVLLYLGPNRVNVFLCGAVLLIACFMFGA